MTYLQYFYKIMPQVEADEIFRNTGLIDSETSILGMVEQEEGNWQVVAEKLDRKMSMTKNFLEYLVSKLSDGSYLGSWNKVICQEKKEVLSSPVEVSYRILIKKGYPYLIDNSDEFTVRDISLMKKIEGPSIDISVNQEAFKTLIDKKQEEKYDIITEREIPNKNLLQKIKNRLYHQDQPFLFYLLNKLRWYKFERHNNSSIFEGDYKLLWYSVCISLKDYQKEKQIEDLKTAKRELDSSIRNLSRLYSYEVWDGPNFISESRIISSWEFMGDFVWVHFSRNFI